MNKRYTPDTGDIIHLHFDLPGNSASNGYKPAVVLSPTAYNKKTGLMVCCAITGDIKSYPFEVPIQSDPPIAVLSDQVKSIDWVHTKISHHGRISANELAQVRAKLLALLSKA
ncbi:type II toxin-antitoxin system PemK/MazF family toxin [Pollutimonas harenae]|uniref:Type II toxin-antitoxin system PemK/MazF family toxin n=1 Tax=Pollutimonas harenae TaxID=657015 RepID=A0A853H5D1_9BURK|nr:type II toxin-antitoxin system PemK/MazF family toxin [Pollutimonas harenae]NYT85753.1 type II toxin-antitoxin system PemK/MazF family toxin [Pollutimonas harenae]TEA70818.1 toxin MazF [Pollutimonas harenae]